MGPTHPTPKVNAATWSEMLSTAAQASKNWFHKYVVSTKDGGYDVKKKSEMGKQDEKLTLEDITAISLRAIKEIEANAITNIRKGNYNLTNESKEIQEIDSVVKNTITLIQAKEAKKDRVIYQILRIFATAFTGGKYYRDRQPKLEGFNAAITNQIKVVKTQQKLTKMNLEDIAEQQEKIAKQQPMVSLLQKEFGHLPEMFSTLLSLDKGPIPGLIQELAQLKAQEQTPKVQREYQEKKSELGDYIKYIIKITSEKSLSFEDAAERVNAYIAISITFQSAEGTLPTQQYLERNFKIEDKLYNERTAKNDGTQFFKDYTERGDTFFIEDLVEGNDGPIPSRYLQNTPERSSLSQSQKEALDQITQNDRVTETMDKIYEVVGSDRRWISAIRTAVSQVSNVCFMQNFSIMQALAVADSSKKFAAVTSRNERPVKIKIFREKGYPSKIASIQVTAYGSVNLTDDSSTGKALYNIVEPGIATATLNYEIELDKNNQVVIKDVKLKYESPLKSVEIE